MTQPVAPAVGDQASAGWAAGLIAWLGGGGSGYAPTLTATTTNPTLGGSGSTAGRYTQVGKLVVGTGLITFGSSGTAAGNGVYLVSLPGPADSSLGAGTLMGRFTLTCAGLFTSGDLWLQTAASGLCRLAYTSTAVNGAYVSTSQAVPGAWTVNDKIQFAFHYLAA